MYFTRISSISLLVLLLLSEVCFVSVVHAAQGNVQENRKRLIETNSCPGCDLTGADLNRANLPGANLQGANLAYAQLHLATLTKANLQNSVLKNTELNGANLADADLRGADLRGTNFTDAYLVGIKLDRKNLLKPTAEQAVAESTPPAKPAISAATGKDEKSVPAEQNGFLRRTWGGMMGLIFGSDASEEQAMESKNADLSQRSVSDTLSNSNSLESSVETEKSSVLTTDKVSFPVASPIVVAEELVVEPDEDEVVEETKEVIHSTKKLVLEKKSSDAVAAPKEKAVFDSTAEIEKNKLRLLETKKCYDCNLAGVDLTGKNLSGADLEGADLTGSKLVEANLENANLKGAILVKADLRNAKLKNADFYKANLSKADLSGAKLEGALIEDAQVSDTMGYK